VSTLTARYGKGQTAVALLNSVGNEGLTRTLLAIMGEGRTMRRRWKTPCASGTTP
jgi:hypothetical protein